MLGLFVVLVGGLSLAALVLSLVPPALLAAARFVVLHRSLLVPVFDLLLGGHAHLGLREPVGARRPSFAHV